MIISRAKQHYLSLLQNGIKLPLFYQAWWLDTVCKHWEVSITKNEEEITGIFPFQIEKKFGTTLLRTPPLTPYLGPYFFLEEKDEEKGSLEAQIFQDLLSQFPKWDFLQFETMPEFQNFHAFHFLGFTNSAKITYFISLKESEEYLFSKIHSRRRNYIRKAEKNLLIIEETKPDTELFEQWHRHAFTQKQQKYPFSGKLIRDIIQVAENNNSSLFLTAKNQSGDLVAMLWTPFDEDKAYHLLGAYDPNNNVNGAMDLLVWTAIKKAKERGNIIYDFEGSMDPGIESFFRKFGGERRQYFYFQQNKSLFWKIKQSIFG